MELNVELEDLQRALGLALREQLTGAAGQYGIGEGALKIAPTSSVP